MKYFPILEQPTKEAVERFVKKRNFTKHLPENYRHPQEDYLSVLESLPVFVVADGVTLDFEKFVERGMKYPNPSPAGDVARIFCQAVIESVQEKYNTFRREDIIKVFKEANAKVGQYNRGIGKTEISGNITGFYAATGSFVVIKNNKAYWASICDSFVAHFDKEMNVKFISSGSCTPYAVINGEERMVNYLESGVFNLEDGDRVFVFTDGFEHSVKNPDFLKIFTEWNENIKERVTEFSKKMNLKDPKRYGHERSLIVISF